MTTEGILLDLDGTLADTAPDLAAALNRLRAEHGMAPMDPALLRRWTSNGTRGMLFAGFAVTPEHPTFRGLAIRYLELYGAEPCVHTRLFPGWEPVLAELEARGLRWGVVTNKPRDLAATVMAGLGLAQRSCCLVGGLCASRPKPSPEPLLLACAQAGLTPARCHYVGDDQRDIIAGRAAGMRTLAASWGYLGDGPPIAEWGAEAIISRPEELLASLEPAR